MKKGMRRRLATGVTTVLSAMMFMTPVFASTSSATTASSSSSSVATSSSSTDLSKDFSLPKSTKLVKSKFANRGSVVTFDLFFQVNNQEASKSLELVDPLNSNFQFLKTKVFFNKTGADGNSQTVDITDEGKAAFDSKTNTTNWKANNASDWFGQTLDMRVKVKVNKQIDLSKIPNQGYSLINGKKTSTDTVNVETLKPANLKPVVKTPTPTVTKQAKVAQPTKEGLLPQTKQMIQNHPWIAAIGAVIIVLAGVTLWRSKKRGGN
ncbi:isopeptide-forming domain-containing fimbrial protein [Pediococcus inopinatus]|uniref:isopeptide-forming domain-containing fimbrial protein n=1 Tax=Pediococcus inopinatus TaxID=114090 RepID=UPI00070FE856|nr:isopeptide-forming domain-containing fimbrial protein [Pediococcus inopinatus]AVL00172.1 hypothetical protein PI20285_05695 [Pediococcus inopinatus]KRN61817.1 hypothetical protein IV83_GL000522 [Pediococcus inopinatus]